MPIHPKLLTTGSHHFEDVLFGEVFTDNMNPDLLRSRASISIGKQEISSRFSGPRGHSPGDRGEVKRKLQQFPAFWNAYVMMDSPLKMKYWMIILMGLVLGISGCGGNDKNPVTPAEPNVLEGDFRIYSQAGIDALAKEGGELYRITGAAVSCP